MSSLLARFAGNIYWLGRYLERAENIARILHINETYGRDDPQGPDWRRVLRLYSDEKRFLDEHEDTSPPAVLRFYVLDRNNPTSISSAIASARENARSVRHLISTEMWTQLNIFSGNVRALGQRDLRVNTLSSAANLVVTGCQTFEGIAEGTFLRGEPWCFYQIGKYLERADQTTRILDIGFDRLLLDKDDAVALVQWNLLLRSVSAYHAYRSRHPGGSRPHDIASFLLYDTEFPRAVALCVQRLTDRLQDIETRHNSRRDADVEAARRALEFSLETGPGSELTPNRLHKFLDGLQIDLGNVSNAIRNAYFV
ncbi:MAG: alpha-E domain-containing protein [Hyphomicrobiaceae bacterium]|nr:alpha-E domain-containing protein [Hyphomicrobiaceae bacterium]